MAPRGINADESKAIREYAYAKGEYKKLAGKLIGLENRRQSLEKQLAETKAELASTQSLHAEALARLNDAKKGMATTVPVIPLHHVRAIAAAPKLHTVRWGDYNRELIEVLKIATVDPISTGEIMQWFSTRFGISLETPKDREELRERIGKRLRELAKRGIIRRLPITKGTRMAYWLWVGLE